MPASVDLPIVDLDTEGGRRALRQGLEETGFFLLRDHEVPAELLGAIRAETARFFAEPVEEKRRYQGFLRGYTLLQAEHSSAGYGTGEYGIGDLCEKYSMGHVPSEQEIAAAPGYYQLEPAQGFFAPNVFPNDGFARAWQDYFDHMQGLSRRLMEAVRETLGLPGPEYASHLDRPADILRYLNYPEIESDEPRMAAHYDDNLLTLLHQSVPENGFAALEVMLPGDDVWRAVPPDDRYFVVNVGDSLMYLTEGRAVATKHRVVNPPGDQLAGSSRTSIAFFHLPNFDCPLKPISTDRVDRTLGQFAADFDVESLVDAEGFVPYYRLIERASERGFNE